jgi:hypothetical protein
MNLKTTIKLNLIAVCIGLIFSTSSSTAQENSEVDWTKMSQNKNANFFEVQQNFYEYWEGKTIRKGSGYKPFKRWEAFMKLRVGPSGDMSAVTATYDNFMAWQEDYNASPASRNVLAGDWTPLGPVGKPSTPAGQAFRTGTGRINFIKIHPTNSQTIFVGTPDGGLWKSTNGGGSWSTNTDFLGVIGCSDLVFDPSNPQIMYLATGDIEGDKKSIGILKSTNGGTSWSATGLAFPTSSQFTLSKLLMDPTNPLRMIVSSNAGIAYTTDGWVTVQSGNFPSGTPNLKDMELKPGAPNTVYASGTKLYKSTDFGANWTEVTNGLPNSNVSRIALAVSPANGNYVYAVYGKASDQSFLGLYRSTDSGATFSTRYTGPLNLLGYDLNGMDQGSGQAFYDLEMIVSPTNADKVTLSSINQWQTTNGGTSWTIITHWTGDGGKPTVHSDFHAQSYDPANSTTLYSGSDGGIWKSTNDGVSWTDISNNLNISQINKLGLSQQDGNKIITGMQDNGTNYRTGNTWNNIFGGDGGESFIDYSNNNTVYFCYVNSEVHRSDDGGVTDMQVTNGLPNGGASGADFYSSFHQDPVAPATIYSGGHAQLYRSTNKGDNWTALGTPQGNGNITEFAIAPSNTQTIYTVKADAVAKSTNGGTSFTNITGSIPTNSSFSMVAVKNNNPDIVWVTQSGFSAGEKVWKSTNGGTSWTNVSTGLPNMPVNTVVSVNNSPSDAIYIGADIGVYYLDNSLTSFAPFSTNLPNVAVRDLEIHYPTGKIRAATYGRGVWQSNDNPLGVEENVFANGIIVHPNPVSDQLTLELPNNDIVFKFDIVNTNGQVVYSGSLQNKTVVDTSSFATGLYIIKLENNKTFEFKKIIKR